MKQNRTWCEWSLRHEVVWGSVGKRLVVSPVVRCSHIISKLMGSHAFTLQHWYRRLTCEYITNIKEEQAYSGAVGSKNQQLENNKCHETLLSHPVSSQVHCCYPPVNVLSDWTRLVMEVHGCGLICILFLSQGFGIIGQSITSRSNYDCGFFTVHSVCHRVRFSIGVHVHVVNKAADTEDMNRLTRGDKKAIFLKIEKGR